MAPAATATVKTIKRDIPFNWEGMDKKGNRVKGKSLAPDEAALRADPLQSCLAHGGAHEIDSRPHLPLYIQRKYRSPQDFCADTA